MCSVYRTDIIENNNRKTSTSWCGGDKHTAFSAVLLFVVSVACSVSLCYTEGNLKMTCRKTRWLLALFVGAEEIHLCDYILAQGHYALGVS